MQRDNAKTSTGADTPDSSPTRRPERGCPAPDHDELPEMELLGYDLERELQWSRVRGQHLRRGGTVRWSRDGFVLQPGVAGVRGKVRFGPSDPED